MDAKAQKRRLQRQQISWDKNTFPKRMTPEQAKKEAEDVQKRLDAMTKRAKERQRG